MPSQTSAPSAENLTIPTPITGETAHVRMRIETVENAVGEIKDDIREIKNHRHTDFVRTMQIFAGGFVLLAGIAHLCVFHRR